MNPVTSDPLVHAFEPVAKSTVSAETTATKQLRDYALPACLSQHYVLGQELGNGGFGFVVSAKARSTNEEVAIKFIYKHKVPATSLMMDAHGQCLPMEIYILKHASHDTIVRYIDSFDDSTYYYLVMELHGSQWNLPATAFVSKPTTPNPLHHLPDLSHSSDPSDDDDDSDDHANACKQPAIISRRGSCDLFECIEQHQAFPEPLAKYVFRQIVECVSYLDTWGVCHRDIKDENIVIDANYQVKLIDFGSAVLLPRHFDPNTPNNVVMHRRFYGTIAFASPEILRMEPYQAEPAEVWSLGVLLYTLVFGEVPFNNAHTAMAAQWYPSPKQHVSSKCLHLIHCLLGKNPQDRPSIHRVLSHPWLQC
ncbi:kinase-like protein [Hesseltinella vesiculosa]|uniref:Kinase-like protein n=1 Tax=Hesseltinella vesiculosa TaxID=101127 RepID=A0A1X2GHV4_9FUNG|nr:kinase-like protein [Hesseltinella vesiculosa]